MPSNYVVGRRFEYRTRDKLRKLGAAYVMRAAQSKGLIDLLALWPRMYRNEEGYLIASPVPWLCQCKTGTGRMGPVERKSLISLAELTGGIPVLARPGKNGRGVDFLDLATHQPLGGQLETRHESSSRVVPGDAEPPHGGTEVVWIEDSVA